MSKLLKLSTDLSIDLALPDVLQDGLRFWVTGESGSGKSNTCMLVASQWLAADRQLIVFDSHGEYENLWSVRPMKVTRIGYGEAPVNTESVEWVMSMIRDGRSVLIDLKHWTDDIVTEPLMKFVSELVTEIFRHQKALAQAGKAKPVLMVVEEAQNFVPQMQSKGQLDTIKLFTGLLTAGRKFGLNVLLASQRQSLVDHNTISQCNVRIFMRTSDTSDFEKMKKHLPKKYPLEFGSGGKKDIKKFKSGESVVSSRWFNTTRTRLDLPTVRVRKFLSED